MKFIEGWLMVNEMIEDVVKNKSFAFVSKLLDSYCPVYYIKYWTILLYLRKQ